MPLSICRVPPPKSRREGFFLKDQFPGARVKCVFLSQSVLEEEQSAFSAGEAFLKDR